MRMVDAEKADAGQNCRRRLEMVETVKSCIGSPFKSLGRKTDARSNILYYYSKSSSLKIRKFI